MNTHSLSLSVQSVVLLVHSVVLLVCLLHFGVKYTTCICTCGGSVCFSCCSTVNPWLAANCCAPAPTMKLCGDFSSTRRATRIGVVILKSRDAAALFYTLHSYHQNFDSSCVIPVCLLQQTKKTSTLWGRKLHPFNFLNNYVKPCSMLIIFGTDT